MLLRSVTAICDAYLRDASVQKLLNHTRIHVVPSLNPDGHAANTRENAHNYNLDRNFHDRFDVGVSGGVNLQGLGVSLQGLGVSLQGLVVSL
jgi:hypothetical protein